MSAASTNEATQLARLGSATIYEAGGRSGYVDADLVQIVPGGAVAGPARTVRCGQDDNLMVHAVMAAVQSGDMLVLDRDGVAVVERERVGRVLAAAQQREEHGIVKRGRLETGELSWELDGLREKAERGELSTPEERARDQALGTRMPEASFSYGTPPANTAESRGMEHP